VLTFDDGFRDFLTDAWPVIHDFGFTATMFVPTAYIADRRQWLNGKACLTWAEIRTLHRQGVSFGSHSVTHPLLHKLPVPELRRELRHSRLQLERELATPVHAFAYPYALPQEDPVFLTQLREILLDEGYRLAVTTAIGRLQRGDDPLLLRRLPMNDCDDEALFLGKLDGAYDWMAGAQRLFRAMTARAARVTLPSAIDRDRPGIARQTGESTTPINTR
jgi:peptidoglycan/xylan/chitin deacetylase (PgdA/CDA1 family)